MKFYRRLVFLVFLAVPFLGKAQLNSVIGRVVDSVEAIPLEGALVEIGKEFAVTDAKGLFTLSMWQDSRVLRVGYVGYQTRVDTLFPETFSGDTLIIPMQRAENILNTVTVTSSKYGKALSEVTVSLEVLEPRLQENTNRNSLDALLAKVPGVTVIDGQANIRGGSGYSYGAGTRVLLLLDDMPILFADAGFPSWDDMPVENLGQVEVIKGASSALYGTSAMNGVVNFRTVFPSSSPETHLAVFTQTWFTPAERNSQWWDSPPVTFGTQFSHRQRFDRFDLVLGAAYLNENSYNKDTYLEAGRVNARLRYRLSERLHIGCNGNFNKASNGDFLFWKGREHLLEGAAGAESETEPTRWNIDPYLTYRQPNGNQHTLRSRFYNIDNQSINNRTNTSKQYFLEYQFQRNFPRIGWNITSGSVLQGARSESELYGDTIFTARNLALYLQLDKKFGDRLSISGGFRIEANRLENPGFVYDFGEVAPSIDKESRPVFRFGLNYRAAQATYLRANWGQGYRFPTIAEKFIFSDLGGFFVSPNPNLRSEIGWSAEIGVKQGFKLGAYQGYLDLAVFRQEYEDMMEFNFVGIEEGFQSLNIGGATINGVEFSLGGRLQLGSIPVQLLGGYLWMDPRFEEFDTTSPAPGESPSLGQINAGNSSSKENYLKYRSLHSFKLDAEAQFKKWSFGAAVNYASKQEAIDAVLLFLVPGVQEFRSDYDQGFLTVDGRLHWKIGQQLKLGLILDNALNATYSVRPGLLEPPRNISLRLDWDIQ